MRDHKTRSEWEALIEEQNKSGLSKIKFCKEKGIAISRFYYYKKLLRDNPLEQNTNASFAVVTNSIVPIQITKNIEKAADKELYIKLILKNGLECILPLPIDKKHLQEIVEVLTIC